MLEGKAIVGESDMLQTMQQYALNLAAKALDYFDVTEATDIARFMKKVRPYSTFLSSVWMIVLALLLLQNWLF